MKIAIWHNLPSGGGKRALYEQVKGLVSRGHVVESWCPQTAAQNFLPMSDLILEHIVPLQEFKAFRGIGWRYELVRRQMAAMQEHCKQCAASIESRGFDIALAHPCVSFRTSPISLFLSTPAVIYLQEPFRWLYEALPKFRWLAPDWMGRIRFRPRLLRPFIRDAAFLYADRLQAREELRWAQSFRRILVNSLFSRESVLRAYGLESYVSRLGIDTEKFQPAGVQRGRYVIGLGNISYNKGIDRVVKGLATMPEDIRPELIWVGNASEYDYEKEIRDLANASGVRLTTKVLVDDQELVRLLSGALCMVYASRLEPFGFAPLEANACGTPVVGLAEGGVRETLIDGVNGFLVTSPGPKAFGDAVERFSRDINMADQMGRKARAHVAGRWGWKQAVDDLESHLFSVLDEQRNGLDPALRDELTAS